jgi:hypothetical protein
MMACHAARVIRQRHKAEHDMLETDLSPGEFLITRRNTG